MNFVPNRCVCQALDYKIIFPIADWNFASTSQTAQMCQCSACQSLFPKIFPDENSIALAYRKYYTLHKDRSFFRRFGRVLLDMLRKEGLMRNLPGHIRSVLDYGCGSGAWLTQMKAIRPELELVGTDLVCPSFQSLPFRWISLDRVDEEKGLFEWITLSHVLEHLPDPLKVLQELVQCLAPGGSIWIATPNAESYLFLSLYGRARDADFPRHRQIFSRKALEALLIECGLEVRLEQPSRVNALLNLASGLAVRKRPPVDISPPISVIAAFRDTVRYLFLSHAKRLERAPELIMIGQRPSTFL